MILLGQVSWLAVILGTYWGFNLSINIFEHLGQTSHARDHTLESGNQPVMPGTANMYSSVALFFYVSLHTVVFCF